MKGQVRKRDLLETGPVARKDAERKEDQDSPPLKRCRAPKNQFAKEVDNVVSGLHQKAESFKQALKEKAEREKENSEQQKALNTKLDVLIDTTNAEFNQCIYTGCY